MYCANCVILACSKLTHCLIIIDLDMFHGCICHNNIEDTRLKYFIINGNHTFISCTVCVDSFKSDRGLKYTCLPRCACLFTMGILHLMNALEKDGMTMLSVQKTRALISFVCSVSAKGLPFLVSDITSLAFQCVPL